MPLKSRLNVLYLLILLFLWCDHLRAQSHPSLPRDPIPSPLQAKSNPRPYDSRVVSVGVAQDLPTPTYFNEITVKFSKHLPVSKRNEIETYYKESETVKQKRPVGGASTQSRTLRQMSLSEAIIPFSAVKKLRPVKAGVGIGNATSAPVEQEDIESIYTFSVEGLSDREKEHLIGLLTASPQVVYAYQNFGIRLDGLNSMSVSHAGPQAERSTHRSKGIRAQRLPTNDPLFSTQWNLQKIGIADAWGIHRGSRRVRIGIIDTGIDYTHPDLKANLWINSAEDINGSGRFEPWPQSERRNPETFELDPDGITGDFDGIDQDENGYPDDVIGWDFVDQPLNIDNLSGFSDYEVPDPDPFDDNSHGTACAGIAAAVGNNGIGISGVAPECRLVALRVFTASGGFAGDVADDKDIASAIVYAADNGIDVLNMSFGDVVDSPIIRDAMAYAFKKGVIMCASSGNVGGDRQRYPAAYQEAIAVGATTPFDAITQFTTYGIRLALCAPGSGIPTTVPFYDNFYTEFFSGTSAAAPHVAGVAALLRSRSPGISPEEVRGLLVGSTVDIEREGWDHFSGAGRLSASDALRLNGGAIVALHLPRYETGLAPDEETVSLIGTAVSPRFREVQVYVQPGIGGSPIWSALGPVQRSQRLIDTLATWSVSALPDTDYTVRVVLTERDGRRIELRQRMIRETRAPRLSSITTEMVYKVDRDVLYLAFETDQPSEAAVWLKSNQQPSGHWISFPTRVQTHFLFLTERDLMINQDYRSVVRVRNRSGMWAESDTLSLALTRRFIQQPTFGQFLFREKPALRLPSGWLMNAAVDYDKNGRNEVIISEARPSAGLTFGQLKRFEFTGTRFFPVDSSFILLPMAVEAKSDAPSRVLAMGAGRSVLFRQQTLTASPFSEIEFADTSGFSFWGASLADTKGDGITRLIARNDTAYFIMSPDFRSRAFLPNPIRRGKDGSRPVFQEPRVAVGDFDRDGKPEILTGDGDGNFFIYEYTGVGENYDTSWVYPSGRFSSATLVTSGSVRGNGKTQFLIGFRNRIGQTPFRDYEAPVWTLELWEATGNNRYERIWRKGFYGQFRPAATLLSDVDKDGRSELVVMLYPNLYVLKWNESARDFEPIWHLPTANAQNLAVMDADANGLNEIYFSDGRTTFAVEYQNYDGPLAPTGITAEPLSTAKIALSWQPVPNVEGYQLYRAEFDREPTYPFGMTFLAHASQPFFIDSSVFRPTPRTFVYAVTAKQGQRESDTTVFLFVRPSAPLKLERVRAESPSIIKARFSDRLRSGINAANFVIYDLNSPDKGKLISSVTVANGGSETVITLSAPLSSGHYALEVRELRSVLNAGLDTLHRKAMFEVIDEERKFLFVTESHFTPPDKIEIQFNKSLNPSLAIMPSRYRLEPMAELKRITLSEDKSQVTLIVGGRPIGATGVSFTVTMDGLLAEDGSGFHPRLAGNAVSFSSTKETLEAAYVYPNPYRASRNAEHVMFANLTPKGKITIYTTSGKVIKRMTFENTLGGVKWELDTDSGERVSSGVYIYRITAEGLPEKMGKIAVIR